LHTQLPVQVPLLRFSSSSFYEDSRLIFSLTLYDVIYAARNSRLNCPFRPVKPEVQDKAETRDEIFSAPCRVNYFLMRRALAACVKLNQSADVCQPTLHGVKQEGQVRERT